ncbi:hypothetical protein [Ralstonia phage phiRSL1]|uniref:Uncharacterized protein n=1 Tax=Ralstonia phage phiRSL1 TaxID=1980924 RepID=B2ZXM0_9CAUD|nr:hypothetical protein RSL1_ORF001 [Ralstonia phage phiRSL1]BAG41446.1 hypothetical protein [Ralstonia phage phiRSL1]
MSQMNKLIPQLQLAGKRGPTEEQVAHRAEQRLGRRSAIWLSLLTRR